MLEQKHLGVLLPSLSISYRGGLEDVAYTR